MTDIVDRLRFDAVRCEVVYSKGIACNIEEAINEIERLREWKSSILSKCKASDGFDALPWGGDKDGWGFVHYFIGHLETRALHAETVLAEQGAGIAHDGLQKLAEGCRTKAELYARSEPTVPASFIWVADEIERLRNGVVGTPST